DDLAFGNIDYKKFGAWPGFNLYKPFYHLGTLYAVYDFLETDCGVRWYMPGDIGRVAPKKQTLSFKPQQRRFCPWTYYRIIGGGSWGRAGDPGKIDLYGMARYTKYAPIRDNILYTLRTRRGGEAYSVCHSVYDYYKCFGKKHPDWFVNNTPGPKVQLKYSKPEVVKQVIKDAYDFFSLPPGLRRFGNKISQAASVSAGNFFSVMPLDNRDYGKECMPPLQPERQGKHYGSGVASNYIFAWVNKVAKAVRKKYPGAWISTAAYAGMFEPSDFNMEPNVAVTVCMAAPGPYGMKILKQWRSKVSYLNTWEYNYDKGFPNIWIHSFANYT
ncbi:MAG: DUF4838 domain-containing protein, partial [Bacteroidetes bacterium]